MKAISSKYILHSLFGLCIGILFISCDYSRPLSINDVKNWTLTSECGTIAINGFKFSTAIFIVQEFNGAYLIQPDSLKIKFYPTSIKMKNMKFSIDDKTLHHDKINKAENKTITLNFNLHSDVPYSTDTAMMFILPCNYIICNNKPLITDTIKIYLK